MLFRRVVDFCANLNEEGGRAGEIANQKQPFTVSLITGAPVVRIGQPRTQIEANDEIYKMSYINHAFNQVSSCSQQPKRTTKIDTCQPCTNLLFLAHTHPLSI